MIIPKTTIDISDTFKPLKLNVAFYESFEPFFLLSEEERNEFTFFYFVVPTDSLLELPEEKINLLRNDYTIVNCYGLQNFIAPLAMNVFETKELAMIAQAQFGRNL